MIHQPTRQKLYCYADESGQDTRGSLFVVATVIVEADRESLRQCLQRIEKSSGKGGKKWTKSTQRQRVIYVEEMLRAPGFEGRLFWARFAGTTNYAVCILDTIAEAIRIAAAGRPYEAVVLIDGLGKHEQHRVGSGLRQRGIAVKKVRGLRDESDEFIRLADAVAGFLRDVVEGDVQANQLWEQAAKQGAIRGVFDP